MTIGNLENLTQDIWTEFLREIFHLQAGLTEPLKLELVEVNGSGTRRGERRSPFSLLFAAPLEPLLPQGIYTLHHPRMGDLALFLVPQAPDAERLYYEAVFT
ncbi:MAG: hypothetical protein H6970_05355 [Gammaproteobacteria bacterium]|nr:hypothetical protein [Gammaproteobacteria bacterium]MCP5458473.1 hypothetical protein [Gammaproteobacteria bacterium]